MREVTGNCVSSMAIHCFSDETLKQAAKLLMRRSAAGNQDLNLLCSSIKSPTMIFIVSCYAAHAVMSAAAAAATSKAKPLSVNACV